jgi:NodT family efflux transporter outer membrane factor (OMF) lipoprotein
MNTETANQKPARPDRLCARPFGACAATVAALLIAGCTVGPKYHTPSAPVPTAANYKESTVNPQFQDTDAWKVASPQDAMLRGNWWEVFHDPELNALEDQLNINNQTIKQYFENYIAARAQIRQARAQYYPTVTVGPSFNRTQSSGTLGQGAVTSGGGSGTSTGAASGQQLTIWDAPADISWAPDLFGRVRNTVREYQAAAQVSEADLENERLLEQATLAETYFEIHGQDALQDMLNATAEADKKIYDLTQSLYDTGIDNQLAVEQAKQTWQGAQAQATNAAVARAQYEHAIATLLGKTATDFSIPKRPSLPEPPPIPTGTPSQLLERRPDIAAAERQMEEANAVIGIGYAAYYPTLTLSAEGGFESSAFKKWFTWPSRFWSIGPSVSETVFDAGLRRATIDQYIATYNADVATYRQTVLTAFQQVEDYLAQTRIQSQQILQQQQAVNSAQKALELEKDRYDTGLDPYIDLMTQQTTLLTAQQTLISLQVTQMTSAVLLVEALGGGWDRTDLPTKKQVTQKAPAPERKVQQ